MNVPFNLEKAVESTTSVYCLSRFKSIMPFLVLALLSISSIVGHTAVFSIVPKAGTSLPTYLPLGGSVTALYTVTNTTSSPHAGNYVKYLTPNTTQVTDDVNYCGATFQLAPNASCTLKLNVTGPVNENDPNPQDHLFVCLGGCVTCCAGTNFPLNVKNPIFTAIFDAGSSGTRLSFYDVLPGNGGYPIIDKHDTYSGSTPGVPDNDGINDFLSCNGSIKLSLGEQLPPGCPRTSNLCQLDVEPCVIQPRLMKLDEAVAALNVSYPGLNLAKFQVQVELFATAGMRTEDQRNGGAFTTAQIVTYYDQMKAYVAKWGYGVGQFKTINGNSEEGVWTWTNLNDYYYNSFGGNPTVSPIALNPVGDFEVGGSSMQIAFPTRTPPSDAGNVYPVSINHYSYNVYSKTFLGLGGDDARKYVKADNYLDNNGGVGCYANNATQSDTQEKSGIQLYPRNQVYPGSGPYPFKDNDNLRTPWTTVSIEQLQLATPQLYNSDSCSTLYDTTVKQVTSLPRNNDGTLNEGARVTMESLKLELLNSTASFIGTDGFFYTSRSVGYAPTPLAGFDSARFKSALQLYCAGNVEPDNNSQNVCPNGNFMYTYLFGPSGLFTGSHTATFAGVLNPANPHGETVLTWTRGYLLLKYAN